MTEEYCIWNSDVGRMDTSTDWGKLFDLCNRNDWYYNYSKLYIIPTRSVGKGKFQTLTEMQDEIKRMCRVK